MDTWTGGELDRWIGDRWIGVKVDRWTSEQVDRWTGGHKVDMRLLFTLYTLVQWAGSQKDK